MKSASTVREINGQILIDVAHDLVYPGAHPKHVTIGYVYQANDNL